MKVRGLRKDTVEVEIYTPDVIRKLKEKWVKNITKHDDAFIGPSGKWTIDHGHHRGGNEELFAPTKEQKEVYDMFYKILDIAKALSNQE